MRRPGRYAGSRSEWWLLTGIIAAVSTPVAFAAGVWLAGVIALGLTVWCAVQAWRLRQSPD
jgi:hypothetical protein